MSPNHGPVPDGVAWFAEPDRGATFCIREKAPHYSGAGEIIARGITRHDYAVLQAAAPILLAALEHWKCPSCGGNKTYTQRGADVVGPKSLTGSGYLKPGNEIACKVCEGGGLHPTARVAIAKARGDA